LQLDGVHILLAPLDTWHMDDLERRRRARYAKYSRIERKMAQAWERKALQRTVGTAASSTADSSSGSSNDSSKGYWQRLLARVLDNVQITLTNVHIRYAACRMQQCSYQCLRNTAYCKFTCRMSSQLNMSDTCVAATLCRYEDSSSVPERPLSVGITLAQLLVQTTDAEWHVTYVQKQQQHQQQQSDIAAAAATTTAGGSSSKRSSVVHKLVSVEGLAVYCDALTVSTAATTAAGESTTSDVQAVAAAAAAAAADKQQQQHSYLLYPCSPSLRLQIRTGASLAG
jgi:Vacuolar sorting-associated protein 13, N-terminal